MSWGNMINFQLWGNNGQEYAIAGGVFLGLLVFFKLFQVLALSRLKKLSKRTKTDMDDFLVGLVRHIKPPFYLLIAFYLALKLLETSGFFSRAVFGIFVVIVMVQTVFVLQKVIDFVIRKKIITTGKTADKDKEAMIKLAGQLTKFALWVFGLLLVLSNLGFDVTSLVAGLGIGGIAIALAVKDLLGDVFASFSIFIDKPFKVGDFIEIGPNESGTVKRIGIKTTRLQTRKGQELIVANKKLTEATLQNYGKMKYRRISFDVGVVYGTSLEKLKKVSEIAGAVISAQEDATFERAHFKRFADSSLVFEIVYLVKDASYQKYMDVQQQINFGIFEKFEQLQIEFAHTTQTVCFKKESENSQG